MNDTENVNSTETRQGAFKTKRRLTLSLSSINEPDDVLVFNQDTSSYQVKGDVKQCDDTSTKSSSISKITDKFFPKDQSINFDFEGQYYCARGRNNGKTMQDRCAIIPTFNNAEDCSFYGVYDGHSTDTIADMLKDKLHGYVMESYLNHGSVSQAFHEGFEKIERKAITKLKQNKQLGGSTALCAMIKGSKVHVANVGDCRAVIISDSGAKALNNLHDFSNTNEEKAVDERGGVIIERGLTKRLHGELAISRSIGDFTYKDFISAAPEISEYTLSPSDNFLLLATDGFWNVINPESAAATIKLIQNDFKELNSVEELSEYLVELACNTKQNSKKDNMILMVIDLQKLAQKPAFTPTCKKTPLEIV